jgi:hypothetical protein
MMIHFSRKRCLSVLTTRAIRMWDRGAKKFISLKDFKSVTSRGRNLGLNGEDLSIQSARSFAQSVRRRDGVIARLRYQQR